MDTSTSPELTSNTPVQVRAQVENGSIFRQYHMDIYFDKSRRFHCRFRTSARLVRPSKKVFIYLLLDASHVSGLETCNDAIIPQDVTAAVIGQGCCKSSSDVLCLRFTLRQHAPLVCPDSRLQKRPETCKDVDALLRLGQCKAITVYLPSGSINQAILPELSAALSGDGSTLQPGPDNIKTLYAGAGGRLVTHLEEIWALDQPESPPAYDPSTAPGAANKRPLESPKSHQAPVKRRLRSAQVDGLPKFSVSAEINDSLGSDQAPSRRTPRSAQVDDPSKSCLPAEINNYSTKSDLLVEPWQRALAAQSVQLAALSAQVAAMREEMQQYRRVQMVDAETQTDSIEPTASTCQAFHRSPTCSPRNSRTSHRQTSPSTPSSSQTSTIENTVEDRLMIVEEGLIDEQRRRQFLEEKIDVTDKEIKKTIELDSAGFEQAISDLETRQDDLEHDITEQFKETLDEKSLEIQIKLEEFIEHRLEDVEEVIKKDIRIAMEHASYKFKMDLCWVDT